MELRERIERGLRSEGLEGLRIKAIHPAVAKRVKKTRFSDARGEFTILIEFLISEEDAAVLSVSG